MVIGIDRHGERVGGTGDGMRRLQHLSGVERVGVGVIVLELRRGFVEDGCGLLAQRWGGDGGQIREAFVEAVLGGGEELEEFVVGHGQEVVRVALFRKDNFL